VVGLLFAATPARAQGVHLAWPDIGGGPAGFILGGQAEKALRLTADFGFERNGDPRRVFGGLVQTDLFGFSSDGSFFNFDGVRFDVSFLVTVASSYKYGSPFYRIAAGPLASLTAAGPSGDGGLGFGVYGEGAAGFKGFGDLYVSLRASAFDSLGPAI